MDIQRRIYYSTWQLSYHSATEEEFNSSIPKKYGMEDIEIARSVAEAVGIYYIQARKHKFEIIDYEIEKDKINFWFPKFGMETLLLDQDDDD